MTLGEWLKSSGMTQEAFAQKVDADCTQALVSKWARGVTLPSLGRRMWIEALTGRSVTARGLVLRYRRLKAKSKARGEAFRAERGIE
jgi:transcriptional regulator with XRE-family HTH domain